MCVHVEKTIRMATFSFESCVRGFHVYKDIWSPEIGDMIACQPEFGNIHDPYAVSVVTSNGNTVGHVPRTISTACTFFIRRGGTIICQVTGQKRYSSDLVQGGLEIPCIYTFSGSDMTRLKKIEKLLSEAPAEKTLSQEPPSKKSKRIDLCNKKDVNLGNSESEQVWLSIPGCFLTLHDKEIIMTANEQLNDRHINFSQQLLLQQFPETDDLMCILFQKKIPKSKIRCGLQIIHARGRNHWLLASTLDSVECGTVEIYDSVFSSVDEELKSIVQNLFELPECPEYKLVTGMQKQVGGSDCGLFSISVATSLLHKARKFSFCQDKMRNHLKSCLESKLFSPFPS